MHPIAPSKTRTVYSYAAQCHAESALSHDTQFRWTLPILVVLGGMSCSRSKLRWTSDGLQGTFK